MCSISEMESIVNIILKQKEDSQEKVNNYSDNSSIIDSTSLV